MPYIARTKPLYNWLQRVLPILVVFSDYNVPSLFYSSDGGKTFTSVGGNPDKGVTGLAPSVRCALIIPNENGTYYLAGTSTGLYGTTHLDGTNTIWEPVAPQLIGNTVVDWLASRPVDRRVAVATHGRGLFVGVLTDKASANPNAIVLSQNYPNPFNPSTVIRYNLPAIHHVTLQVYDILGRLVETLIDKTQDAGFHTVTFTGRNLASGMYIYRLKTGKQTIEKKMIYLK